MAVYAKRTCPGCGSTLEGWHRDTLAIGNPLISCPNCAALLRRDNVNEWELLRGWQRVRFVIGYLYSGLLWMVGGGFLVPVALAIVRQWLPGASDFYTTMGTYLSVLGLPLGLISFIVFGWQLSKRRRESLERMRDPAYREKLTRAGVMP